MQKVSKNIFNTLATLMIALGIIGEYVWRSLDSSRKRPNFVIDKENL